MGAAHGRFLLVTKDAKLFNVDAFLTIYRHHIEIRHKPTWMESITELDQALNEAMGDYRLIDNVFIVWDATDTYLVFMHPNQNPKKNCATLWNVQQERVYGDKRLFCDIGTMMHHPGKFISSNQPMQVYIQERTMVSLQPHIQTVIKSDFGISIKRIDFGTTSIEQFLERNDSGLIKM